MPENNTNIVSLEFYQPSELLNIFGNFLTLSEKNYRVIGLRGVYLKSDKVYNGVAYDHLRDEKGVDTFTILMPVGLREGLNNGNLITVYGTLGRKVDNRNGAIQFQLNVSRLELVKEVTISEEEMKRAELRRVKEAKGYKNVDSVLENKLFVGERPRVALIYADTSITNADFEKGLNAAKASIDFLDNRVSFANTQAFCNLLEKLDGEGYDVIAIVRGGGGGLEKLDEPALVEKLVNLNTPWIYGVGHEKENLFIRNVADKTIPIPFALGTYFRDMVESVAAKRNNSRAVLVNEVKKQFEKQIADSNKKNAELNKQLEAQRKASKEQAEQANKKIEALTKANKEQTEAMQKANAATLKQLNEQIEAGKKQNQTLQGQLKTQNDTLTKMQAQQKEQQEGFNKSLEKMQQTNKELQTSLNKLNAQNTQAAKDLAEAKLKAAELERQLQEARKGCAMPGCMGVIVLLIVSVSALVYTIF